MKLNVSPARRVTLRMVAAMAAPVLIAAASSGPVVNASAAAIAPADATHATSAHATLARSPEQAGVREAALRAEVMRLQALGLHGPVVSELAAHGTGLTSTGLTSTGLTSTGPIAGVTSGTITGVVRGTGDLALRGVCVTATSHAGAASTAVQKGQVGRVGTGFAITGPDGRYVLTGLRPGPYTLSYRDCAAPGRYLSQWSGATAWPELAKPVSVSAGQVQVAPPVTLRSATSAALPTSQPQLLTSRPHPGWIISTSHAASAGGGRISGIVSGNGNPLKDICVIVWRLVHHGAVGVGTKTSRTGSYSVGGLRRGRYQVEFGASLGCQSSSNWLPQWYNGVNESGNPFSSFKPTTIVLKAGQKLAGIDAHLKLGGQISGIVTGKSGKGLSGICVQVGEAVRDGAIGIDFQTGRSGRWALHAVSPGRYTVEFSTGCKNKGNYAPQWWRDSPTAEHATKIHIVGPEIAGDIDAKLQPGAAITGVVSEGNAPSQPLSGVCVSATSRDGSVNVTASTTSDGSYRIDGLGAGRYQLFFDPTCGDSITTMYLSVNEVVTTRAGATKAGVNVLLPIGAGVSGTVTDSHGNPLPGICVEVANQQGGGGAVTGADGTYTIEGVPAGPYQMQFAGGCGNSGSYAPQYYNDESNPFDADYLTLTTGDITPSVDAAMQPGGTISGVVTNQAGHRLGGMCVAVEGQSIAGGFGFGLTSKGNFRIPNLAPGLYAVEFGCGGIYASQWFKSMTYSPDWVSVSPGTVTRGVDAALSLAGTISGVVTDQAGHPLSGICAAPFPLPIPANASVQAFVTSRDGAYRATSLAPGTYAVEFGPCLGHPQYGNQWYRGKTTLAAATRVRVTSGGAVKGIGAVMTVGGSITGQIRAAGTNEPLRGACAVAIDNAAETGFEAETNATGHYTIEGLATGNYQLLFAPCDGQNLVTITRPGTVHVTAPRVTTHINAALPAGGTVSGTVLGGSPTATPQEGVCVDIVPTNPNGTYGEAVTAADGTYTATGLPTGSYQVLLGDPTCGLNTAFTPNWYNGKPSQSTADTITVTQGSTTSGIDASLLPGGLGAISGTVTGPSSAPVAGECVTAFNISAALSPLFNGGLPEIAVTQADGSYSLGYLLPGTYKVEFSTGCGASKFGTQWWDDASTESAATTITVSGNATTTGINAGLQP